ncbi:MAG: hypothetical protein KGQ66_05405 [Acidobacteriota bacterium]|nr:hypothetical protein [Acidobacteriota bacterium]
MTYLDHDLGPDGASRAPGHPVTTQRTPSGASTPPMLDLQRLAGNAAVSQAIKSGQFDSEVPVQRLDGDTMEEEEEEIEDAEETEEAGEEAGEDTGDIQDELDEEADEEEEEDDVEEEAVDEQEEEAEEEQEEAEEEEAV